MGAALKVSEIDGCVSCPSNSDLSVAATVSSDRERVGWTTTIVCTEKSVSRYTLGKGRVLRRRCARRVGRPCGGGRGGRV